MAKLNFQEQETFFLLAMLKTFYFLKKKILWWIQS